GYYSFDLGTWHIISLNSNIPAGSGSTQLNWLRADLLAHPAVCTLAYWHHPLFDSGSNHGTDTVTTNWMTEVWRTLYEFEADVVLTGHEHIYERFAPQRLVSGEPGATSVPVGESDPARGIREFIIGTGGKSLYAIGTIRPNSEVRYNATYGVLKLTLHPT